MRRFEAETLVPRTPEVREERSAEDSHPASAAEPAIGGLILERFLENVVIWDARLLDQHDQADSGILPS